MIRIFTLLILFAVSPVLSANMNVDGNIKNEEALKPIASKSTVMSEIIMKQLEGEPNLPTQEVVQLALRGYFNLLAEGKITQGSPLTIIDFSLPSSKERLWILDLEEGKLLHRSLVAHGRNSGDLMAKSFSNVNSSFKSSLGFYVTAETYEGKHGYSLRLDGLETGFNDMARQRAIVIHGADYANRNFVRNTGRLGRSLGCPALPMGLHKSIINTIKEGSCLFIYAKDSNYLNESSLIQA